MQIVVRFVDCPKVLGGGVVGAHVSNCIHLKSCVHGFSPVQVIIGTKP